MSNAQPKNAAPPLASDPSANAPRVERRDGPGGPAWWVLGRWTAAKLANAPQWRALQATWPDTAAAGDATPWNLTSAEAIDHVGAQMLWGRWGQRWPQHLEISPAQQALLERVARFTRAPDPPKTVTLWQRYLSLGDGVLGLLSHLHSFVLLLGQLALDLVRLLRAPWRGPWRDISGHLYHFGATALPITALVGFLIGVVLAYLSAQQLKQFGADAFIVNLLGVSLVRELGPMLAAILVAGRSGSAITAQIGVMRVTEELDAMRVMGIPLGFRLVMPRALALAIAMPLISVWTTLVALLGGMVAADIALGVSPTYFVQALPSAVDVANLTLAVGKTVVFGLLIALIGCHFGLRVEPNTESLGKGTTASVVTSITVVIIVDALFAIAFRDIGV
ncbi:ABC transporter permease [Hydrogenophaga sp. PAMC20947]|uniref:MlaE family ABC transporter permease n=1 Tax=Hydrogenophaga sp. PAMC20947 TaxID=2565558 RepID=UPI00109DD374|nr:ABC transporter permease [Hydrogenophaga sp. PAMC20947]QCB45287.1 ABC transporter permease [Hydrogenophaga sp. PAMC20947]